MKKADPIVDLLQQKTKKKTERKKQLKGWGKGGGGRGGGGRECKQMGCVRKSGPRYLPSFAASMDNRRIQE